MKWRVKQNMIKDKAGPLLRSFVFILKAMRSHKKTGEEEGRVTIRRVFQNKSLCLQDGYWIREGLKQKSVGKNEGYCRNFRQDDGNKLKWW